MQEATRQIHVGPKRIFLIVWGWLLAITVIETVPAYQHLGLKVMLVVLIGQGRAVI